MPWTTTLLDTPADSTSASLPINLLDLLVHPQGFASARLNLSEVGPVLLSHLRNEASPWPAMFPKVDAFADHPLRHAPR